MLTVAIIVVLTTILKDACCCKMFENYYYFFEGFKGRRKKNIQNKQRNILHKFKRNYFVKILAKLIKKYTHSQLHFYRDNGDTNTHKHTYIQTLNNC